MRRFKPIPLAVSGQILLYAVQYLIIPRLFWISPSDTARNITAIVLSTGIIALVWMLAVSDKLVGWILGIIPYFLLILAFHPAYSYGIGNGMFDFDILTIVILSFFVMATEIAVWSIIKACQFLQKR